MLNNLENLKKDLVEKYEETTKNIEITDAFNKIIKLFKHVHVVRLKNKFYRKYYKSNLLDIFKGSSEKEIFNYKNEKGKQKFLLSYLISYLDILLLLLAFSFFKFENYSFAIFLVISSYLSMYILSKTSKSGRYETDILLNYYLAQDFSVNDLLFIEQKYYDLVRDIYTTKTSKKSAQIIDVNILQDDEKREVEKNLGLILEVEFSDTADLKNNSLLQYNLMRPFLVYSDLYEVYLNKCYIFFDKYLADLRNIQSFDYLEIYQEDEEFLNNVKDFEKFRKNAEIAKMQKFLKSKNLNIDAKKLQRIIENINKNSEKLGFNFHNQFSEGVSGSKDFIKLNCVFLDDFNISKLKKNEIESVVNADVDIVENANSKKNFTLVIILRKFIDEYVVKYDELMLEARKNNSLILGKTLTGKYIAEMTNNAFFPFISGESGSGKSATTLALMTQVLELRDSNFKDLFILSGGKTGDYFEAKFNEKNALIVDVLESTENNVFINEEQKVFQICRTLELIVRMMLSREALFKKHGAKNIYNFNKDVASKNTELEMGEVLIVIDEFQSMTNIAKNYKLDSVKCDSIINSQIRKILSLGRASGFKLILVSQSAKVSDLGDGIKDGLTVEILGRNKTNVLSGVDMSGKLAKYFSELSINNKRTEGVVFIRSTVIKPLSEQLNFKDGFVLAKMPFLDNKLIAKNFNKMFETSNKYLSIVQDLELDISEALNNLNSSSSEKNDLKNEVDNTNDITKDNNDLLDLI